MPGEDENLLNKEQEKQEELHVEEHAAQQQENALAGPVLAGPVLAGPVQNQLQQDIEQLTHAQRVVRAANGEVEPARPVFIRAGANANIQNKEAGSSKSKRKQAALDQKRADEEARTKLKETLETLQKSDDTDDLVKKTLLFDEQGMLGSLGERVDVTGHLRRKNAKKYFRATSSSASEQAHQDVTNLVNNLRRDLAYECDGSTLPDMQKDRDAYYISRRYGEGEIHDVTNEVEAIKERIADAQKEGNAEAAAAAEQELKASKQRLARLQDMVLWVKANGSNYAPNLTRLQMDIAARRLAKQRIQSEGNSRYNQLMQRMLDEEIETLQASFDTFDRNIKNINGKVGTPHGDALATIRDELSKLRRQIIEAGDDSAKQDELFEKGKKLIKDFDYGNSPKEPAQNP